METVLGAEIAPNTGALGRVFVYWKHRSAKRVNERRGTAGAPAWQRNDYYEHIIRNDESSNSIRDFIANKPLHWELDRENPDVVRARSAVPSPKNEPWRI